MHAFGFVSCPALTRLRATSLFLLEILWRGSIVSFKMSLISASARPEGVEPPTFGFEVRRSIQLSYGREPIRATKRA